MDTTFQDLAQARIDCENCVLGFFYALDTFDNERAASSFTTDGVWNRQGKDLVGREAIRAAVDARARNRRTCHLIENFRLVELDGEHAVAAFYLVAYEGIEGAAEGSADQMRFHGVRDCRDRLVRTSEGWRIAHKGSTKHLPM